MPTSHPSILLVEDDLSLRDSLCQFLTDHGYRTLVASTATHGWEMLRSRKPRLVLLDLNLPDGSGLDFLKKIIEHRIHTRVIVMTAFDLAHLRPSEPTEILAAWMTKPVSPVELLEAVERALDGQATQTPHA